MRNKLLQPGFTRFITATCSVGWMAAMVAPSAATAQPVVCIADGTPEEFATRIAAAAETRFQLGPQAANVAERWTRTASDGFGIKRGDPITLTWSVVPDGTGISGAIIGEASAGSSLRAFLNTHFGMQAVWLDLIQQALDGWNRGPGVRFVYEPNDDGIHLGSGAGVLGVRGDIRLAGHRIDGDLGTVAYAFFPGGGGDIVIDTDDRFNSTALSLHNVLGHEAGHSIGLGHTCPTDRTKLMEPLISTLFSGPQFDDLLGAHRNYGDIQEENDTVEVAADLGLNIDMTHLVEGLALDGNADDDWFAIPEGSLTEVSINVNPAGTPYPLAAISGGTCPSGALPDFDPAIVQDLNIAIIDSDGTSMRAAADATFAGGSESVNNVRLSKLGGFVRISGAGIDDTQAYDLEITLVPEPASALSRAAVLLVLGVLARQRRQQREFSGLPPHFSVERAIRSLRSE